MASLPDIAAMKIEAITQRGSKKDFVDIYFLSELFSLSTVLEFYNKKFKHGNSWMALKSLLYFDDAETQPMPKMEKSVSWKEIKESIISQVKSIT